VQVLSKKGEKKRNSILKYCSLFLHLERVKKSCYSAHDGIIRGKNVRAKISYVLGIIKGESKAKNSLSGKITGCSFFFHRWKRTFIIYRANALTQRAGE